MQTGTFNAGQSVKIVYNGMKKNSPVGGGNLTTRPNHCHNDGHATHNHPHNLRWDTRRANVIDKFKHGTHNFLRNFTPRDKAQIRAKAKAEMPSFMSGDCDCFMHWQEQAA